jgi:hypothetical protein
MTDAPLTLLLLAVASACLVIITATFVSTTAQLRHTLGRINALLPDAAAALRETRRSARQMRQILVRGNCAARRASKVVGTVYETAMAAVENLQRLNGWPARLLFR